MHTIAMRAFSVIILLFAFFISGLEAGNIEVHDDHHSEQSHSLDVTFHSDSHDYDKQSNEQNESSHKCQHFHFHSSSPVRPIVSYRIDQELHLEGILSEVYISADNLINQFINSSLYRPPIS